MPDTLPTIHEAAEEYPVTLADTLDLIHFINNALKQMHCRLTEAAAKNQFDDPGEQQSLEEACTHLHEATKSLDVLP